MEKKLEILMLEDLEEDAGLIEYVLKKDGLRYDAFRVDTKEGFIQAIREHRYDLILSDHSLPQFNSMEALKICRRLGLPVPFILITGTVSEEFAVTCLKQGADDYVLKSNLSRLPSAIKNALNQRKLQEERLKAELELRLQNEELTKVNQEMDSFVYSISHNLRAPLMSVLGLLNIVKREDEQRDKFFEEYFNMMIQSVIKLDDTLKEILDFSKNGRNEIDIHLVDLHELIDQTFERLRYIDGFDKIEKKVIIENGCPFYSDAQRLTVIFNNLISNAIKYRDAKKQPCQLTIEAVIKNDSMRLQIKDNGIGIRPELLPKVFNMFFRATEKSDGAGLGLYIVKETINKLRGKINLESAYGMGTQFTIDVPNSIPVHVNKHNDPFVNVPS